MFENYIVQNMNMIQAINKYVICKELQIYKCVEIMRIEFCKYVHSPIVLQ